MKTLSAPPPAATALALSVTLALLLPAPAAAQSIGRIQKSLNKAVAPAGQAPAAPSSATAVAPSGSTAAQISANEAAANQRNKAAQVGVEDRVVTFLKQRIEDGSADAAFDLAKRYEEGKGVTADPAEARRLYTLAAERGNEEAKDWLAKNPAPEAAGEKKDPAAPDQPAAATGTPEAKEAAPVPQEPAPAPAPKP